MSDRTSMPAGTARSEMRGGDVRLDLTGALAEEIGPRHGIGTGDWRGIEPDLERVAQDIQSSRRQGRIEALDLPYRTEDLASVRELAERFRSAENFVVLGIGGYSLGARALCEACLPPHHNLIAGARRGGPRLIVAENVDPDSLASLLDAAPPRESVYNVVSGSGNTVETVARFLVLWDRLRSELGAAAAERVVVTTDPARGFLRSVAREHGLCSLAAPSGVGERFSVLSPVGLLPAAVAGIEPEAVLAGAARMDDRCREFSWKENPGLALAGIHVLMDRSKGKTMTVLMPYADGLRSFAEWVGQLWAESLGKRRTPSGESRGPVGQTPLRAVGATDQHTQLQLYVDGPNDKLITLVAVERPRREVWIPPIETEGLARENLSHVPGRGIGEVLSIERSATEISLREVERPVLVLEVPELSADAMGQLFYLYEWAAIAAGMLYHVDPFDQPGVEEGKRLTDAALGRPGREDLGDRVREHRARTDRFRI